MQYVGYAIFGIIMFMSIVSSGAHIRHRHLRGLRLLGLWQTRVRLSRWQRQLKTFVWGRFRIPLSLANQHFLVAGTVGSGKTVLLRLLMQSVLPRIGQGLGDRALIYDGKGDMLNIVLGMKQPYQTVFTFDPFDEEGVRWDIAADVTDDASATQTARLLFPKQDGEHQPFFPESVQNLAANVMQTLNEKAPGDWRLSHLLFIMRSSDRIQSILQETEKGRDTLSQFIHSGETWGNITATIANRISDYEIVAALWDHAPHAVSLKEWNETESILVLRKHHMCSEVVDAVNRVILAVAKRRLLSKMEDPKRRTWVIMDELASLGEKATAKELNLLMEQGRSRNVCVALGFQNIASLRDEFTQYGADRLVALCSTKALLRFEDGASAEWAAGFFGKQEVRIESTSSTSGKPGSKTLSIQDQERWTVLPSEFISIPRAGNGHGLTGYFLIPDGDPPLAFRDTLPPKWLFGRQTLAPVCDRTVQERHQSMQRSTVTDAELDALLGRTVPAADQESSEDDEEDEDPGTGGIAPPLPPPQAPPGGGAEKRVDPVDSPANAPPLSTSASVPSTTFSTSPPSSTVTMTASGMPNTATPKPVSPSATHAPDTTVQPSASSSGAPAPSAATPTAATVPPSRARTPSRSNTRPKASTASKFRSPGSSSASAVPTTDPVLPSAAQPAAVPNEPQVWDLREQTIKPASIWDVQRPAS